MQKLRNLLVALLLAVALTWMPSSAQAADVDYHPGLQFAIQPGTGNFVQFQSGAIYSPGQEVHVYYDALRASSENPSCPKFSPLTKVTGHVMSDNAGTANPAFYSEFELKSLDPPAVDFVKVGEFKTPKCYNGSSEIQIWFTGTGKNCYDSAFGSNYHFPVICK